MKTKLTSRKFWVCVAAFLGSIGMSIAGMNSGDSIIAVIGTICATASTGIYAICETIVDSE